MPPLLIAHRGASYAAPENTMAAFRRAWDENADGMECDVRLTKDGQILCIHDETTARTTGVDLAVAQSDYAELKGLDAGSWKHADFTGEPLPLLSEALQALPHDKRMFIEVKCGPEIVPELSRLLSGAGKTCEQVAIISFHSEVIKATRSALPNLQAYWISSFKRKAPTYAVKPSMKTLLKELKACQAHGLDCKAADHIDEAWVAKLKATGYAWHVWTIDDAEKARRFAQLGVESITTNRPGFLRDQM